MDEDIVRLTPDKSRRIATPHPSTFLVESVGGIGALYDLEGIQEYCFEALFRKVPDIVSSVLHEREDFLLKPLDRVIDYNSCLVDRCLTIFGR